VMVGGWTTRCGARAKLRLSAGGGARPVAAWPDELDCIALLWSMAAPADGVVFGGRRLVLDAHSDLQVSRLPRLGRRSLEAAKSLLFELQIARCTSVAGRGGIVASVSCHETTTRSTILLGEIVFPFILRDW